MVRPKTVLLALLIAGVTLVSVPPAVSARAPPQAADENHLTASNRVTAVSD